MQARRDKVVTWPGYLTSMLVLITGLVVDNVLSASVHGSVAAQLFPVAFGLLVGSLTVLTFVRRVTAFVVAASIYSAMGVITLTLTLSRPERLVLLALCLVTTAACLITPLIIPTVGSSAPVRVPVETHDDHR